MYKIRNQYIEENNYNTDLKVNSSIEYCYLIDEFNTQEYNIIDGNVNMINWDYYEYIDTYDDVISITFESAHDMNYHSYKDCNYLSLENLELPAKLKAFVCDNCNICTLPYKFPNTLVELSIADNNICDIPDKLPRDLTMFYASYNKIYDFNLVLPENIINISINNNNVATLPVEYPESLDEYDITDNNIKYLSKPMIDALIKIFNSKCNPDYSIIKGNAIFHGFDSNAEVIDYLQNG